MSRRVIEIDGGTVIAYGHYGRPLIAFPSENGEVSDWEDRGMVHVLGPLLEQGRLKLYCVRRSTGRAGRAAICRSRSARGATVTTSGGC